MSQMTIGIIGGNGLFGKWLVKFFKSLGQNVIVSDLDTEMTNEELVKRSNVVVFSILPISQALSVINKMVPFSRKDQLWIDVTSLKYDLVEAMKKSKANVVGLHPMCAPPKTNDLRGQTMIVCPVRVNKVWDEWVKVFLTKTRCNMEMADPGEHDKMSSLVQGVPQALLIVLVRTLMASGVSMSKIAKYSTSFNKILLSLISRLLSRKASLYCDIQIMNKYVLKDLKIFRDQLDKHISILENKNSDKFLEAFERCGNYIKSEDTESYCQLSDTLISYQADLDDSELLKIEVLKKQTRIIGIDWKNCES